MQNQHSSRILAGLLMLVTLTAASCGPGVNNGVTISDLSVTRSIGVNNEPTSAADLIPASAKSIFLSGRVDQPQSGTKIKVIWSKLPNLVISTQDFSGLNNGSQQYDFDKTVSGSYFASEIDRTGITWEQGEYKADVYIGSKLFSSVFFKVVSDTEADTAANKKILGKVSFGDSIDDAGVVTNTKTTFDRSTGHIYITLALAGSHPGAKVETSVRYLKADQVINTFTTTTGQDQNIVFDLSLAQFGRLWTDHLWPSGGFEVLVKINGTAAATQSFIIG